MSLQIGQVLERRYRIETLLGQGGMGAVYAAIDLRFNTRVAIKENLAITPDSQRQFGREAGLLHQLRHPNLPRVTDHFSIPDQGQYLVMDYIEGEDLKCFLAGRGPVSEGQALEWIGQVLDALEYLHSQQVIHRDVKPANVKITPQGQVFLVDFGLAKVYDPQQETTIGARGATPGYAPPEQYGQGRTDARSDVYSAGATLYSMLTGQIPPDALELVIRQAGLISVRQVDPKLSPEVDAAVMRAMQIVPDDRFQMAAEFRAALLEPPTRVGLAEGPQPTPATPVPARRQPPSPEAIPRAEREIEYRQRVDGLFAQAQAAYSRQDWTEAEARSADVIALDAQHGGARDLLQRTRVARQLDRGYAQAQEAMQAADWETATVALEEVLALDASYRDAQTLFQQAWAEQERQRQPAAPPLPRRLAPGVGQRVREALAGVRARVFPLSPRFLLVSMLVVAVLLIAVPIGLYTLGRGEQEGVQPGGEAGGFAAPTGEGILFTSDREGKREVYRLRGGQVERVTQTPGDNGSWSPVSTETGILFTSDRDGKREIYRLRGGQVERATHAPGRSDSWSAAPAETGILFTSDRDWKREIYRLHRGQVERVTQTPGDGESWSAVWTETGILFTSNRDGKREIYRLSGGQVERVTQTPGDGESWSAVWTETGILFTSDRDGKREIYRLRSGQVERVTQTPGRGESWAAVWTETGVLFTSNRDGKREIYRLRGGQVERLTNTPGDGESWLADDDGS